MYSLLWVYGRVADKRLADELPCELPPMFVEEGVIACFMSKYGANIPACRMTTDDETLGEVRFEK